MTMGSLRRCRGRYVSTVIRSFDRSTDKTHRRVWRVWSVAAGADVTWGLLGEMTRLLDVNPAELEEREALRWDMPAAHRCVRRASCLVGLWWCRARVGAWMV